LRVLSYASSLYDLDLDPITLILDLDLDIPRLHLRAKNEVCRSRRTVPEEHRQTDTPTRTDATETIITSHLWMIMSQT